MGETSAANSYWEPWSRSIAAAVSGNRVAISCHNCYVEDLGGPEENAQATLDGIHKAQQEGADVIELDVKLEDGAWRIGHSDNGSVTAALLHDVLRDEGLRQGTQLVFVEVKEQDTQSEDVGTLLVAFRDAGLAAEGRPVVLRAFSSRWSALDGALESFSRERVERELVRLHLLHRQEETEGAELYEQLQEIAGWDLDGVEFDREADNVLDALEMARRVGFGVGVWGLDKGSDLESCTLFRDVADCVTIDAEFGKCREAIEAP